MPALFTYPIIADLPPTSDAFADVNRALVSQAQAGDDDARVRLLEINRPFVAKIAKRYHSPLPMDDRMQEGLIGLNRAIDRFDLSRPIRFCTFAAWWIRQAIGIAVENERAMVHVPHRYRLRRRGGPGTPPFGRLKTDGRKSTDATRERALAVLLAGRTNQAESAIALHDLAEDRPNHERSVDRADLLAVVCRAVGELPERWGAVLRKRYGLEDGRLWTHREIGRAWGLSRQSVVNLERRALEAVRQRLGVAS